MTHCTRVSSSLALKGPDMKQEQAARSLIYAIRRMGFRIYLEQTGNEMLVRIDREDAFSKAPRGPRVPQSMIDKGKKLKAHLIAMLSRPSDPEAQANAQAWSEIKLMQVRAVKMEGQCKK